MSSDDNSQYFARRAAEERLMMEQSASDVAREAHRRLADLYLAASVFNDGAAPILREQLRG